MRLVERLDEIDGNPDDEEDDPGGGNAEDEGEAIDEAEREQMIDEVPCLQVFAIEPDAVTGKRQFLGMSNLSPGFVSSTMPASV